ncbi:hypothetical protein ACFOLC_13510 [Lysobacter cavernae]|uniref:Secreted protein n=1 Tax=Lysobacter cavernae TaxID=1685901 RepID=A0ABV7RTL9_9GAMM
MRLLPSLMLLAALLLTACAVPAPQASRDTAAASIGHDVPSSATVAVPPPSSVQPEQASPAGTPAAPEPTAQAKPVQLITSCRTDADCTVKDVGNCCGSFPSCVNVNSPTDPKGVQAQCAKRGMMSVCGFKAIEGCQCVKGECQNRIMEVEAQ